MNNPIKIQDIIGSRAQSRLVRQARLLLDIDAQLQQLLPDSLRPHCRLLSVNGNKLVLAADSPAWAARLRFQTHQLLRQLRLPGNVRLRGIRIRVRPPEAGHTHGLRS
ncbi:MAG: DUF721 domain-containing protein [Pseudomonadota bacterium]